MLNLLSAGIKVERNATLLSGSSNIHVCCSLHLSVCHCGKPPINSFLKTILFSRVIISRTRSNSYSSPLSEISLAWDWDRLICCSFCKINLNQVKLLFLSRCKRREHSVLLKTNYYCSCSLNQSTQIRQNHVGRSNEAILHVKVFICCQIHRYYFKAYKPLWLHLLFKVKESFQKIFDSIVFWVF